MCLLEVLVWPCAHAPMQSLCLQQLQGGRAGGMQGLRAHEPMHILCCDKLQGGRAGGMQFQSEEFDPEQLFNVFFG